MTERGDKHAIIPSPPRDLVKYGSSLVRRGLDDLSKPFGKKGRVLLVDDHEAIEAMERTLVASGYEVRSTSSQRDAIDMAKIFEPQVAILGVATSVTLGSELSALRSISRIVLWGKVDSPEGLEHWPEYYDFLLLPTPREVERLPSVVGSWVAEAWTNEGVSLAVNGRHVEALHFHEKAVSIQPLCVPAWNNKGYSLDKLGRWPEAIESYDRAFEIDPSDWDSRVRKGDMLDRLGRFEEAILCFDAALAIRSDLVGGWEGRGRALDHLGRHEEALHCFDKMLEIDQPGWTDAGRAFVYSDAWYDKGTSLSKMGRDQESIECYDKAIECNPHNSTAWWAKGNTFWKLKKFDEAIACYDKALAIWPEHAEGWHNKGICLTCMGRYQESTECYEKAIAIDPKYPTFWYNKGISLRQLKRFEEAITCYDRALELYPGHWRSWYAKAHLQDDLGRTQDAISSYERYLAVAPFEGTAPFPFNALDRLRKLKSKIQKPEPGAPRYAYVVRDKGAAIEAGDIGYPDIETAILEALRQKWELHAAGKLSDQAYREAFREYQSMIKNHFQKQGEAPNE